MKLQLGDICFNPVFLSYRYFSISKIQTLIFFFFKAHQDAICGHMWYYGFIKYLTVHSLNHSLNMFLLIFIILAHYWICTATLCDWNSCKIKYYLHTFIDIYTYLLRSFFQLALVVYILPFTEYKNND